MKVIEVWLLVIDTPHVFYELFEFELEDDVAKHREVETQREAICRGKCQI